MLSVYEKKEMVCPVCNRHFLGLQALETHISWVHKVKDTKSRIFQKKETSSARDGWCATGYSSLLAREPGCLVGSAAGVVLGSAGGIRGGVLRAAAGAAAEAAEGSSAKKRKLACFVCKELYSDVIALNRHIAQLHLKKRGDSDKDGGLKSQMSTALGGLLDRALSNMLGKAGRNSNQNLRELNKLCLLPCALGGERAEEEEEQHEVEATPPTIFKQEPVAEEQDDSAMETPQDSPAFNERAFQTTLLSEQAFNCQHCGARFSIESSRDEHVAQVHEREVAAIQLPGGFCKVETSEREQTCILPDDPPLSTPVPTYTLPDQHTIPTPEQIAFSQSIERTVPEPPSDELQCPVCLAAMKHYHSLCRHLKTQHCEWSIQAFSTDMYNYLIIKRDSPPELIRKKYSITIPAPRGSISSSTSTSKPDADAESEAADILRGRRPSKPCSNSSGNNSDSGSFTPRQSLEQEADHDSIRAKAFAALRQLNQRPSRYGRVQSVPIRGSKRRPLDIYEFFEDEEVETPPLRQSSTPRQEKKSIDLNEGETKESKESVGIDLPTESEVTTSEDIYGTYECNTCSKSFKSLKAYCRHSQDVCKSVYSYESSSDDNDLESIKFARKQQENSKTPINTATDSKSDPKCDKKIDSGLQLICN
ncbi:hypothetical protein B566_EDAN010781 [Ephemera danica]|nr:hypothetical protein B566_EDAN010781 [Ephemera danica]